MNGVILNAFSSMLLELGYFQLIKFPSSWGVCIKNFLDQEISMAAAQQRQYRFIDLALPKSFAQ